MTSGFLLWFGKRVTISFVAITSRLFALFHIR